MDLDFSEIALFYYQTIPREILHRINHKPAKTNDGPKMTLMRPCPFDAKLLKTVSFRFLRNKKRFNGMFPFYLSHLKLVKYILLTI